MATNPQAALTMLLHKLVSDTFRHTAPTGCLEASVRHLYLSGQSEEMKASPSAQSENARHESWGDHVPADDQALWDWLEQLDDSTRLDLLAHCVSFGINALFERPNPHAASGISRHGLDVRLAQADRLARATGRFHDLALARWLSERGARHLWLLGARPPTPLPADLSVHDLAVVPSTPPGPTIAAHDLAVAAPAPTGPTTPAHDLAVAAPAPTGPTITVLTGDLADPAVIATTLATITARGLPLRGVFHAAGAPDDGVLLQQDPARLARVLATKLGGAWHLHHATRHLLLDHFVLFSSVAGVHGQAGQASYAEISAPVLQNPDQLPHGCTHSA